MMFDSLVPKDHLLVKIDSIIDFSFVYDIVKDEYSDKGRGSCDPVVMTKLCLLEYLYTLSDRKVRERAQTDIAFRWFLGLNLDDPLPDDTTISHFRINRMGPNGFEEFFNEIVRKCIELDLVKERRYLIDTTNVDADSNYPSVRKLICLSFRKVIKEVRKFNFPLAKAIERQFNAAIDALTVETGTARTNEFISIANNALAELYLVTVPELENNDKYRNACKLISDIIDQYGNGKKDKIVSIVDPDARVAYKSHGNAKVGYKDHIIVDEDSEIIISSVQTPFNVNDEKKLEDLVEKAETIFGLKPKEISADKAYGTIKNRAFLKDREIVCNINFYEDSLKERTSFGVRVFIIADDAKSITCPNGITTKEYNVTFDKTKDMELRTFKFSNEDCARCPLREACIDKNKSGKIRSKHKILRVTNRHDAMYQDLKRTETNEFKIAMNKRYIVERRFATLVRNHGLRRCRYRKLPRAIIHITLANTACNIIRMIKLLFHPSVCAT